MPLSRERYLDLFNKLYDQYNEAHLFFYVWKGLQVKQYENIYEKNKYFWAATLRALENGWLVALANLYEDSKYSKREKIVSVYTLLPSADSTRATKVRMLIFQHQVVINNLRTLRHNQLAHNNAEHLLDPSNLLKKFPLQFGKIESLIKITADILANLHPRNDHAYTYELFIESIMNDDESIIEKLLYFENSREAHLKRFVRGEISDHTFPPK